MGFVDLERQLGFGYVTKSLGQSVLEDIRAARLSEALSGASSPSGLRLSKLS